MEKAMIIGLGNILEGDFGVGCYILEALALEPFENRVQLLYMGDDPRCLGGIICDMDLVIVVGALPLGGQPGRIHEWSYNVFKQHRTWLSNEYQSIRLLIEALARTELAGKFPRELIFLWIEPQWKEGYSLSRQVNKSIWKTAKAVKHKLYNNDFLQEGALGVVPMYNQNRM